MAMIQFRPAIRENVGLIITLAGASGSGKTYSALRLAAGIAGDRPFAVIDTENGRALHYADAFNFEHAELRAPFRPAAYADAFAAADAAGYPVIVCDSGSHEHAGDGGLLEWHEEEMDRLAPGGDWQKREAVKMLAWVKPKTEHKRMVTRMLQLRAHLIICLRAEEKVDIIKGADGKSRIVPKVSPVGLDGWVPICEKTLPYEATVSFLLTPSAPGIPKPIKLQEQHRALFPLDRPLDEAAGRGIAAWATGGKQSLAQVTAPLGPTITTDQAIEIEDLCKEAGVSVAKLKEKAGVMLLAQMPAEWYGRAKDWIEAARAARVKA